MHGLHWPDEVLGYLVVALALGFPLVVGLAWIFDVNAGRIERHGAFARRTCEARASRSCSPASAWSGGAGAGWFFVLRRPPRRFQSRRTHSVHRRPAAPEPELGQGEEYFSDGLSGNCSICSPRAGPAVAARTSAFAFKGKSEDVREIAQKLLVATSSREALRKAGDQIRITTQLINASDGYHLLVGTYDRKLTDVFACRTRSRSRCRGAQARLLQPPTSKERRTVEPEAFNQYLRRKQFYHRTTSRTSAGQAVFESCSVIPPTPAWAGSRSRPSGGGSAESLAAVWPVSSTLWSGRQGHCAAPDLRTRYVARGFVAVSIRWDFEGSRRDFAQPGLRPTIRKRSANTLSSC